MTYRLAASKRPKMATASWIWCVFFFSSRRRHTRCSRDWSSDVCSSDLTRRFKTMISTVVRALSRVPIPLRGLAVCVACEECFELGEPTCPSCGSDEHVRSEEHTSELQSRLHLVCRLLLEKKKRSGFTTKHARCSSAGPCVSGGSSYGTRNTP